MSFFKPSFLVGTFYVAFNQLGSVLDPEYVLKYLKHPYLYFWMNTTFITIAFSISLLAFNKDYNFIYQRAQKDYINPLTVNYHYLVTMFLVVLLFIVLYWNLNNMTFEKTGLWSFFHGNERLNANRLYVCSRLPEYRSGRLFIAKIIFCILHGPIVPFCTITFFIMLLNRGFTLLHLFLFIPVTTFFLAFSCFTGSRSCITTFFLYIICGWTGCRLEKISIRMGIYFCFLVFLCLLWPYQFHGSFKSVFARLVCLPFKLTVWCQNLYESNGMLGWFYSLPGWLRTLLAHFYGIKSIWIENYIGAAYYNSLGLVDPTCNANTASFFHFFLCVGFHTIWIHIIAVIAFDWIVSLCKHLHTVLFFPFIIVSLRNLGMIMSSGNLYASIISNGYFILLGFCLLFDFKLKRLSQNNQT
jgi:hypothetical protein